ncbi:MAG: OmpH family outer membrane protein [Phycisphaeraceae bacterium]|nr:OmpH family outer membrane protein [Phycisphaeraceae bacterium]
MRIRPLTIVLGFCLAASTALLIGAQASRSVPPTRVATVNLVELIDKLQEKAEWEIRLRHLQGSIMEEVRARKAKLEEMVNRINAMQDATEKLAALEEAQLTRLETEQWAAMKEGELDREASLMWRQIYRRVREEAAKLAESRGYDYVLVAEPGDELNLQGGDPRVPLTQRALDQIARRRYLYTSPAHDITDELRARLDNSYAVGGGRPPAR